MSKLGEAAEITAIEGEAATFECYDQWYVAAANDSDEIIGIVLLPQVATS